MFLYKLNVLDGVEYTNAFAILFDYLFLLLTLNYNFSLINLKIDIFFIAIMLIISSVSRVIYNLAIVFVSVKYFLIKTECSIINYYKFYYF